ncbi:MAG: aminopeptidase, partial [Clostridia bacterium]
MTKESVIKFSKTVLEIGVNLQKDQILVIACPIATKDVAYEMAKCAYELGAKRVIINWRDKTLTKIRYQFESIDSLTEIMDYEMAMLNETTNKGACLVSIAADDPEALAGCDANKMSKHSNAMSVKKHDFLEAEMSNKFRWCVCSVPEEKWAKKIFPTLSTEESMDKLWDMIQKTMLLDKADPVQAWKEKCAKMHARCKFLNDNHFKTMHYKNSLGTDLHVNMMDDSVWLAADEKAQDGVDFMANLPTEEIFSAPNRLGTYGILYSALPLCVNGNIIDQFCLEFDNGRVVKYSAKVGEEYLKNIIETDDGSHYLGEIAMVQYDSPISNLKTLFYNTLFDENASCHFAVGAAYASCCESGLKLGKDELLAHGVNASMTHNDFMIGTSDLSIVGETHSGKMIDIMVNGNFV